MHRRVIQRCSISPLHVAATAAATRVFTTHERMPSETGFAHKLREVPVITGQARPCEREGDWVCAYPLTHRMEEVVADLLQKNGWSEIEIKREISQIFAIKTVRTAGSNTARWATVEEFQRTPWYARYRPNDVSTTHYISYECMKILEDNLIAPSQRKDPYAHLRKRHLEDQFAHERFSENHARHITREELGRMTPGMPEYGTVSRKKYLQFCKEYDKRNKAKGDFTQKDEQYHAWRSSLGGRNDDNWKRS
jgi:hypothetical protein